MAVSYIYSFLLYLTFNIHSAFWFQKCNINKIRRIPKITSQFRNHTYISFIMEEFHLKQHWFTHKLLQFHNIFSHPDHHRTRVKRTATHALWGQTIFWSHTKPAQDLWNCSSHVRLLVWGTGVPWFPQFGFLQFLIYCDL